MSYPKDINVVDVDVIDESIVEVEGEIISYENDMIEDDSFEKYIENKMICCISILGIGTIIAVFIYMKRI